MESACPPTPSRAHPKRFTVLLAENHPGTRESTRRLLESRGGRVLVAADGRQALEVLEHEDPDLVLCELRMPRVDGFAFISRIREDPHRTRLRVVALTVLAGDRDYLRTLEAGFDGHLTKPLDIQALSRFIPELRSDTSRRASARPRRAADAPRPAGSKAPRSRSGGVPRARAAR